MAKKTKEELELEFKEKMEKLEKDEQTRKEKEEKKKRKAEEKEKHDRERTIREEVVLQRKRRVADIVGDEVCSKMQFDSDGNPRQKPSNLTAVVNGHMKMEERLRKNLFTGNYELDGVAFDDETMNNITWEIADILDWHNSTLVESALSRIASANAYHPILEAVDAIEWDGKPRLETFFIEAVGAEDTPANREASFKWLCAMYRRVANPGAWFDAFLLLQDPKHGTGKSKVFEALGGRIGITDGNGAPQNYSIVNAKPDLMDKDSAMRLNLAAVCEFDEAEKMKYTNLEQFKAFITQSEYTIRLPYDRHISKFKVHCVYALTTNDEKFLTDSTADYERRAWVMRCHGDVHLDDEWWEPRTGEAVVRQVWAEAKHWNEHPKEALLKFGWNIEGSHISFLTEENTEMMKSVQQGAKTWEDDDAVINAIETILTRKYPRVVWENSAEFIRDIGGWTTTFAGAASDDDGRIDAVPVKWLYEAVNKLCGAKKTRSSQYLSAVMSSPTVEEIAGKWVKRDRVWYKGTGRQTTCWVRVTEKAPFESKKKKPVPLSPAARHGKMPEFGTDMTEIDTGFVTSKK